MAPCAERKSTCNLSTSCRSSSCSHGSHSSAGTRAEATLQAEQKDKRTKEQKDCAAWQLAQPRAAPGMLLLLLPSLALLCPLGLPPCLALVTPEQASLPYSGDETHLYYWALNTFNNMPLNFWTTSGNLLTPCGMGDTLPFQGVSCAYSLDDQYFVTKVDLSYSSLPPGTPRLETNNTGINYQIVGVLYLKTLDLSGNLVAGSVPPQLYLAPSLQELILTSNIISGPLPAQLCSLNLTCLSVSNNQMNGSIPTCFNHFPCVDFENSGLSYVPGVDCDNSTSISSCAGPQAIAAPPPPPPSGLSLGAVLGIVFGGLALVALLVGLGVLLLRLAERRRKEEEKRRLSEDIETQISTRHFGTLRRFSAEELSHASNSFDDDNLLGEGGFSKVYKGTLDDGKTVAIKKIKEERKAGELEFLNEVELISRAVHRNLMHCEGFCVEAGACMLVLPFYANGSVASRTNGKQGDPLSWPTRQRIARGAAEGVAYLHTDCSPKLVHRDIKADNVLLDEKDEAVIADFGLAKELDAKETHRTTAVKGTIGHIAPEYFVSGQCSEKTDVYAFGIFLLELVAGKDVFGLTAPLEETEVLLRDWVAGLVKEGKVEEIMDTELLDMEDTEPEEVVKVLQVALLCMQPDPNDRPTMEQVARMLVGKQEGLAERWQKWQDEAGQVTKEDVMQVINTPALWENTTTGISVDGFGTTAPR